MAPLSSITISALLIGGVLPFLGNTTPVEKREEPIFLNLKDFKEKYGYDHQQACDYIYEKHRVDGCLVATDNHTWAAATYHTKKTPAEYIWAQDDTTVTNCLINLHYHDNEKCISVHDSDSNYECEKIKGKSRILNGRKWAAEALTSEQSRELQQASRALVGAKVNSIGNNDEGAPSGVHIFLAKYELVPNLGIDWRDGDEKELYRGINIAFGGAEQC